MNASISNTMAVVLIHIGAADTLTVPVDCILLEFCHGVKA
jgi:hypothetical protein